MTFAAMLTTLLSRPTRFLAPAVALALGLGAWQLDRMWAKEALVEEVATRAAAPPVPLPSSERIGLADLLFRPVSVTGRFDIESEMFLLNRARAGKRGMHLITPLVRADDAGIVLVDRGWIPEDRREPHTRASSRIEDEVTVVGVVLRPDPPGLLSRTNNPTENEWYHIDLVAMAEAAGIWPAPEYYILATAEEAPDESGTPATSVVSWLTPNEWTPALDNNHLTYAVISFLVAAALVGVFSYLRISGRSVDDS